MNDIVIAVNFENDKPTVSGRELHAALEIKTAYKDGFRECVNMALLRAGISTRSKLSEFRKRA